MGKVIDHFLGIWHALKEILLWTGKAIWSLVMLKDVFGNMKKNRMLELVILFLRLKHVLIANDDI